MYFKEGDNVYAGSKRYDDGTEIRGYKVITEIEIREARTGNILYTGSLEGSEPVFPYWITSDEYPIIKGSPANYLSFEGWLFENLK